MEFYPNGRKYIDYCELYLKPISCYEKESVNVKYSLNILDSESKSIITKRESGDKFTYTFTYTFTKPFIGNGLNKFCEVSGLKECIFNDTLQIQATLQINILETNSRHKIEEKNINSIIKLTKDFESTLKNSDFSDFIIKVDDTEIAVHKYILASRSPVFNAMLKNQTSERKSGVVEITDIDKRTMSSLISFMYTTKVDISTIEEAQNLFIAADKYELEDLKHLCENYLVDNLKSSNAIDVLISSDHYNAFTLKNKVIEYIMTNMHEFVAGNRFQKLLEEPSLLLELLEKNYKND